MKLRRLILTSLLGASFLLPSVASAQVFDTDVKRIIKERLGIETPEEAEEYYDDDGGKSKKGGKGNKGGKGRGDGLPPGLAKMDQLPPGLARMETLPPGLSRSPLPPDLIGELPPPPLGTERLIVDDENVVLVEQASGKVLDIIKGKITKRPKR